MGTRKRWTILNVEVFKQNEQTSAEQWLLRRRNEHKGKPGLQVRRHFRGVRADMAEATVIVCVARVPRLSAQAEKDNRDEREGTAYLERQLRNQ